MTKNFDMKTIEYARELARKHNEAQAIVVECKEKLDNLNLDYTARGLLLEDPALEFVEIKSCSIKYLTDKPVSSTWMSRQRVIPQPNGKMLVEVAD